MALPTYLFNRFVNALVQVPITETRLGRTGLLGSFQSENISRDENNRRADLISIIKTLDTLGQKKRLPSCPSSPSPTLLLTL